MNNVMKSTNVGLNSKALFNEREEMLNRHYCPSLTNPRVHRSSKIYNYSKCQDVSRRECISSLLLSQPGTYNKIYSFVPYDIALQFGAYNVQNSFVDVTYSAIPNAGSGVFVNKNIQKGSFITEYKCIPLLFERYACEYQKLFYKFQLYSKKHRRVGIMELMKGQGVGSFINSVWHTAFVKNCNIVEHNNRYYVKAILDIEAGKELYLSYGTTYSYNQLKCFSHSPPYHRLQN
jgi:hypothetical protein